MVQRVSLTIHHLARDARILNRNVAIGEAAALLFLLLWSEDSVLCSLKQVFEFHCHLFASDRLSPPLDVKEQILPAIHPLAMMRVVIGYTNDRAHHGEI